MPSYDEIVSESAANSNEIATENAATSNEIVTKNAATSNEIVANNAAIKMKDILPEAGPSTPQLYILHEHAIGFALFRTTEFEEIAIFLPQVRQSISDISKFRSIVYLMTFQPFKGQKEALLNMKSIAADELSTDLQLFLENNVPRSKKSKQAVILGVSEPNLAAVISDKLGINCKSSGIVQEITRGIRFHFHKLVKGFKEIKFERQAQLALAHHYSREKVNFDFTRQDSMIIQSQSVIDNLDKDVSTLTRRIKAWYSLHFPELFNIIQDEELYVQCVQTIGDRKNMPEGVEDKLITLLEDSTKVEQILQAAHNSMGMEISDFDFQNIQMFCTKVLSLIKHRQDSLDYLKGKVNATAPCMSSLVGESVVSRLISRAGGLMNLAKLPASTVQVLGAEKKLFRTVKGKSKEKKFGVIYESASVAKAGKTLKGHFARALATKCSLAARVDYFSKKSNVSFGNQLMQKVEENMVLYERRKLKKRKAASEETPQKNLKDAKNKTVKFNSQYLKNNNESSVRGVNLKNDVSNKIDAPVEDDSSVEDDAFAQDNSAIISSEELVDEESTEEKVINGNAIKPKEKKKSNKNIKSATKRLKQKSNTTSAAMKRKNQNKKRKSNESLHTEKSASGASKTYKNKAKKIKKK